MAIIWGTEILSGSPALAQAASEADLKAAFLMNFATYVEWGADAGPGFSICVLGDDDVARSAARLEGRLVRDKKLRIVRTAQDSGLEGCQMVFIGHRSLDLLPRILDEARRGGLLTVGDADGLARKGIMINIIDADDRMGFEVNLTAARKAQLEISSRLLRLARSVY